MASIEKRIDSKGNIAYRARVRQAGRKAQFATFPKLNDAKLWAAKIEVELHQSKYEEPKSSDLHTVAEMIDRYIEIELPYKPKSARSQKSQLIWWKNRIGDMKLSAVKPNTIIACRDELASGKTPTGKLRTTTTVNRYLAVISHCFSVAFNQWQWLESSPIRKGMKRAEPRGRRRFLTSEEQSAILAECRTSESRYLFVVVILALSTGMRLGEIMSLRWSQIDLEAGRIILSDTKNGEVRPVPLVSKALELVERFSAHRRSDSDLVFPTEAQGEEAKPAEIRKAWTTAVRKAGLQDFRFHDLRHTCASYLAMNGATQLEIADALGHKTLQMVKRYSHLSNSHNTQVLSAMNERFLGTLDITNDNTGSQHG